MIAARVSAVALVFIAAGATAQTPAPIVSESEVLSAFGVQLAPRYAALDQSARALRAAVTGLCADHSSSALGTAQAAWKTAARQWRVLAALPVGPLLERRSVRKFDFWPTRVPQIEAVVAQQAAATLALEQVGFSAQGLPALEYLLFGDKAPASRSAAHCAFAEKLTELFSAEATALDADWAQWSARWSQPDAAEPATAALGETLNVLIGTLERLRVRMLAKPAATPVSAAATWDAWRSGATRENLFATFEGVQRALDGSDSGPGLLALLRGRGHLALAARIEDRVRRADASLRALPPDLRRARSRTVAPALTELVRLQAVLATDVAEVLRVTIGFNDTDGD